MIKNISILELLITAREKISKPEHWCQGQFSKWNGAEGKPYAWCARGVLYNLTEWDSYLSTKAERLLCLHAAKLLSDSLPDLFPEEKFLHTLVYVNDHLGHDAVLKLYDDAIAAEKARIADGTPT